MLTQCFVIYHQVFLAFIADKSLKLSFILYCVLKRTNDRNNDFEMPRFAFDVFQKFEAVPRHTVEIYDNKYLSP